LKPEFAASQFNFCRQSDWANYGCASKGIPHESHRRNMRRSTALWLADIELNDGRYGDVTGRTIMGLIGK
jgi:hypothetical protein